MLLAGMLLAACHGGSHGGVLPPFAKSRRPYASVAPSIAQWSSGTPWAPSSITVSWPAAPAAGDVLVVAFWNNGQSSGGANTYAPPPGWTLADQNTSILYATYQTFTHVVASGENNSYVFTPLSAERQHAWIAADVSGISGVDKTGNAFINNSGAFTTPAVTPSQSGDLLIAFNMPMTNNNVTWSNPAGWALGAGPASTWHGEALYQSSPASTATSESATLSALTNGFAGIIALTPSGVVATPPPSPSPLPTTTPVPTPVPSGGGSAPSALQWTSGAKYNASSIGVSWPAAPAAGDMLIVTLWNNGQSGGSANPYTAPSGWTLADQNLSVPYATYQSFSHIVAAGESGAYVFTPLAAQRQQAWIGVEIKGASGVQAGADSFVNNSASFTTPAVTPQLTPDLAIAFDLPMTTRNVTWSNPSPWTTGTGPTSTWHGEALYQPLSNEAPVSESSTLSSSAIGFSGIVLLSGTGGPPPTPPPAAAYSDWPTFGDDLARTQYNPNETTLSAANAGALKLSWKKDLGAAITAQPVIAANVNVGGTPETVAYVGTEGGTFYALNADTGATIWSKTLASVTSGCMDLPGGVFGITGSATFDKSSNRIYVADGHDQVHALDMSTGAEAAGWPVTLTSQFTANHVYSGLALNPSNGLLYATTASYCDENVWQGEVAAISTSSASIAGTFLPASPYSGDGIWGLGGPAIDSSNQLYVATGNTTGAPAESSAYGDQLVQLTASLGVLASNEPGITGADMDFGASPTVYQPPGCPQLVSVKNKSGVVVTWNTSSIASGALQSLAVAPDTNTGQFVGATTYSSAENLFYVGVPLGNSTFTHGIVALRPQSDCTLALAWQQTAGPNISSTQDDNDSITVANGVAYLTDGVGNEVFAYDASSGAPLWNSGSTITGPVMVSPTVDGRVFVSSWDHNLYAFGL